MKAKYVRQLVQAIQAEGSVKHDSNGALYVYQGSATKWAKPNDYEMRNFLQKFFETIGEPQLLHTEIEFLRRELSEESALLEKELEFP